MNTYWTTFRIHDDASYRTRYDSLVKAIGEAADQTTWWSEPTSFFMFKSRFTIDDIAQHLKKAIAPDRDVVLLAMNEVKSARLIGTTNDRDIFRLDASLVAV